MCCLGFELTGIRRDAYVVCGGQVHYAGSWDKNCCEKEF